MTGIVKSLGIVMFSMIVMFLIINFNFQHYMDDDIRESTRTTQLTVMQDCINLGDLFVNNKISIDSKKVNKQWLEYFNKNSDTKYYYDIDFLSINEDPPGIAVEVKGYSDMNLSEDKLEIYYKNIVIIDDK